MIGRLAGADGASEAAALICGVIRDILCRGLGAGLDNRGPGRCDSVGRLGVWRTCQAPSVPSVQAMAGLAIEPARE